MCPQPRQTLLPSSPSCVASGVAPKSDKGPLRPTLQQQQQQQQQQHDDEPL